VLLVGNKLEWGVIATPSLRNAKDNSALRKQLVPKLAHLLGEVDRAGDARAR